MITWNFKNYIKQTGFEWEIKAIYEALSWIGKNAGSWKTSVSVSTKAYNRENGTFTLKDKTTRSHIEKNMLKKNVITCAYILHK